MDLVDNLYRRYSEEIAELEQTGKIAISSSLQDYFRKLLVLTFASMFEEMVVNSIKQISQQRNDQLITNFIEHQGLKRKYHTLFSWDQTGSRYNANTFFSLFGEDFCIYAKIQCNKPEMKTSIHDFIELGRERNTIAHLCHKYTSEKTVNDVYVQGKSAFNFVAALPSIFEAFRQLPRAPSESAPIQEN